MTQRSSIERLIRSMGSVFQPKRIPAQATVVDTTEDGTGRITSFIARIGASTQVVYYNGAARQGDVFDLEGDSDPVNPNWRVVKRVFTLDPPEAPRALRQIPKPSIELIVPEKQTEPTQDPGGTGIARACVVVRMITPGVEDFYSWHVTKLHVQYRVFGITDWSVDLTVPLKTRTAPMYQLAANFGTIDTTATIATYGQDTALDSLRDDILLKWWIDDEIIQAKKTAGGLNTMTRATDSTVIAAHLGPYTDGSGYHSGARVTCLSVPITIEGLRPSRRNSAGTTTNLVYEVRVALVDVHDTQGPWSDIVSFNSYLYSDPPLPPASLTVTQKKLGARLVWPKPTDPSVVGHRVFRVNQLDNTFLAALPGWDAGTQTSNPVVPNVAYTEWDGLVPPGLTWDGTVGAGNYFGVMAVNNNNLYSRVKWASDTTAPPAPTPANCVFEMMDHKIRFAVNGSDTARNDEGFQRFHLWRSTSFAIPASLASAIDVQAFDDPGGEIAANPYDLRYYQITSEDWAGNVGSPTLNAADWFLCRAGYNDSANLVKNGNFQYPAQNLRLPEGWEIGWAVSGASTFSAFTWDAANSRWTDNTYTYVEYLSTGGIFGSYCLKVTCLSGMPAGYQVVIRYKTPILAPQNGASNYPLTQMSVAYKASGQVAGNANVSMRLAATIYDNEAGTIPNNSQDANVSWRRVAAIASTQAATNWTAWGHNAGDFGTGASSTIAIKPLIYVRNGGGGATSAQIIFYFDDFMVLPLRSGIV